METHKISPDCPPKEARNDYRAVVDEIKSFYASSNQPNQFRAFVLTKQFNSVQGAVKALRDKTSQFLHFPYIIKVQVVIHIQVRNVSYHTKKYHAWKIYSF